MLIVIVWGVFFVAVIIGLFLVSRFFQSLRERHVEEWHRLGSPSLVTNNSPQSSLKFLNYLRKREYLGLNDEEIAAQGRRLWIFLQLYCVAFLIALVLVLALGL